MHTRPRRRGAPGGVAALARRRSRSSALLAGVALLLAACGASEPDAPAGDVSGDGPTVMATTTILADVTSQVVGDAGEVVGLVPPGADPHGFEASARQVGQLQEADLIVRNGGGLEAGLESALAEAEAVGVPVFTAVDHVDTLAFADDATHEHDDHGAADEEHDHADEEHNDTATDEHDHADGEHNDTATDEHDHGAADEEHNDTTADEHDHADEEHNDTATDEHDHADGATDPHIWMDPTRMATVTMALGDELAGVVDDGEAVRQRAERYAAELTALDDRIDRMLNSVPDDARHLVTNHDALAYFADRYGFEIVGTVIPDVSTGAEPSAADIEQLAATMRDQDVRAIFAETTQPERLAETVAGEVGGQVEVVELYTGSLGEDGSDADTYAGMMETNAQRIADALAG